MRVMTVLWVTMLAVLGLSVGCSSSDEGSTGPGSTAATRAATISLDLLIEPDDAAQIGYRIGWASPVGLDRGQRITSVTALGDLILVVEEPTNIVTALKVGTGELAWKVDIGSKIEQLFRPSRDGEQIFIHSASRFFTLNAKNGKVQSVANMQTSVSCAATYSPDNRLAILAGTNGLIFAHSVDSNFMRWGYQLANRTNNSPALAGQDVFVVDTGGTYAMLETANGRPLWRNRTLGPVNTNPAAQGTEVIVASEDGKLYALNRTSGRDTWTYLGAEQALKASPYALGRVIIQPLAPNDGMIAIDAINGSELWRTDTTAIPVVARNKDLLLHTDDSLVTVDLADGKEISTVSTKPLMTVLPLNKEGAVVLVNANGRLLRLSPN